MNHYYRNLEKPEGYWMDMIKKINKGAVSQLQKKVFQNENLNSINQKLRLAENYVGLDDTHYNVTTIFEVEGKKFGLEDKKWLRLTDKQKSAYLNRESESWYKRLDPFEQKFIDTYVDKFLDEQHYIPTQIHHTTGGRNAHKKRLLTYDENNNSTALGGYHHSGALVSLIQDKDPAISKQITKENWEQVLQHVPDIEVISLNHNTDFIVPFLGNFGEKHIVEPMKHTVGSDRFMNLPINELGTFTTPIFKPQVNKLVKESTNFYASKYPKLCQAFIKGKNMNRKKQIEQIKDPKDKDYFNKLEQLQEAAKNSDMVNKIIHNMNEITNNYYANIGANYIACKSVDPLRILIRIYIPKNHMLSMLFLGHFLSL